MSRLGPFAFTGTAQESTVVIIDIPVAGIVLHCCRVFLCSLLQITNSFVQYSQYRVRRCIGLVVSYRSFQFLQGNFILSTLQIALAKGSVRFSRFAIITLFIFTT